MLNAGPVSRGVEAEKRFRPAGVRLRARAGESARREARALGWLRPIVLAGILGALAVGLLASDAASDRVTSVLAEGQGVVARGVWTGERLARGQIALIARVVDLETQNGRLRREVQHLRAMDRERLRLAHLLQISRGNGLVGVGARVIARGGGGRETVRIDAGTDQGVRPGLAVIGPDAIVGQVLDAGSGWADVLCVTDPSAGLAGVIEGGPRGVLRGTGTGLAMDHVLARHAIAPGMRVTASGEGGVFPAGLLVGVVKSAEPDAGTPFLAIEVAAAAPPDLLDEVLVVTGISPDVALR